VLFEISRLKGNEKIDYDSIDTIDFDTLKSFISEVWHKDEVHCPVFDFSTGKRSGFRTVKIEKGDIFLFEGIQAVYPEVSALFREVGYTSVYISPESVLNVDGTLFGSNELRLMRRIVRDYNFRGTGPSFTLDNWDGVRANEEKNIFPYAATCRFHIDSTFPYEAGMLKPYLTALLEDIPKTSRHYAPAAAILEKIADIEPISGDYIGKNSLYNEFI
jgi:uridine kinase